MPFTDIYSSILAPFVDTYKVAAHETNRGRIIEKAVNAVVESRHLLEDTGVNLPTDLKLVCLLSLSIFLHCCS
jgi:hypothetical protein